MRKIASVVTLVSLAVMLTACGGSDDKAFVGGQGSSSSSSSGSASVTLASLTLTTDNATIPSDGSQSANITALARDASNQLVQGVPVTFSASSGGIAPGQATTDASGSAKTVLSTAGDPSLRTITVTATAGGKTATVQVQVVSGGGSSTQQMGNGSGSGFQAGVIGVGDANISAGGSTGMTVSIVDQSGTLYTANPVTVTFNSPCVAAGQATVAAAGGGGTPGQVTTSTGLAAATYTAKGCSGGDVVTATATVGSQSLSAQGTVTVAAASIGSIQFVSATPIEIGLKGTGLPETSTVVFKVTDATGGPRPNATVSFALDTSVGGLSFSPPSAVSGNDGTVETVVSSGTVHTAVRVTASIASPALSTESSQLTVTTGLPASRAFSIAVGAPTYPGGFSPVTKACSNVEAYSIDGVSVPFTVSLADRYDNPVPGGTAISFYANGGHIVGSCTTPTLSGSAADGTCSVIWTSSNPRPATTDTPPVLADGRAQVLATVIGEESFTDTNANGYWDTGESFDDLGEPYLDADENQDGKGYQSGDYFLDFNKNGVRDGPTGSFVGITCNGSTPGSTCSTSTLALGVSHLIIMSTSAANVTFQGAGGGFSGNSGALTISHGATGQVTFNVQDMHGNSMAAGTAISGSADSAIGSASLSSSSFGTVGCDETTGGQSYTVTFSAITSLPAGQASVSGSLTLSVVSPSGSTTHATVPVTVD
ncbi:MAG: Ig-like domain-containing protein, partial [Steroidobacteraceae bacterium]